MRRLGALVARWEAFLLLFLIGTCMWGSWSSPYFLTASNISIAIAGAIPAAIVALGMTVVIVTGEIDVSVGSTVGLCAATLAVAIEQGLPIEAAMGFAVVIGTLAGLINGAVVAYAGLPSLVVTLGTLALYRGTALIILKERGVHSFPEWYQTLGFETIGATPVPWSSLIFVVLLIGFGVFLHATHWGRALYAIGNNREAARFSGINVKRAILGVFVSSGVMCSIAAIVLTAYLASARADTATGLELPVITAVVLGGVSIFGGSGTLLGVLLALLVLAFVQNSLGLAGVTPEEQQIVTGAVLIVTLTMFGAYGYISGKVADLWRSRMPRQRQAGAVSLRGEQSREQTVRNVTVRAERAGRASSEANVVRRSALGEVE
jgi:rhamnose transport system permease protein